MIPPEAVTSPLPCLDLDGSGLFYVYAILTNIIDTINSCNTTNG